MNATYDHSVPGAAGRGPRDAAERALCDLFARVLQVPAVGIDDDLFDLGGESVHAVTLISEIAATFGVEVPLSTVFDHSTVAELAPHLKASPVLPAS